MATTSPESTISKPSLWEKALPRSSKESLYVNKTTDLQETGPYRWALGRRLPRWYMAARGMALGKTIKSLAST